MSSFESQGLSENVYDYLAFKRQIQNVHSKVMHLSLFVDSNDVNLKQLYVEAAVNHNKKIMDDPYFYDAGFDLFVPEVVSNNNHLIKIDFQVKCCAKIYDIQLGHTTHTVIQNDLVLDPSKQLMYVNFTPFYTYARSSITKTCLRLANNQGIIDAGYRGSLIGVFDNISTDGVELNIAQYSRLLQICAPSLMPIYVDVVKTFEDLGPPTSRGGNGFGSTGV